MALIGLVNPVVGTMLGVLVAGETLHPAQALGVILVLSGVLVGQPAIQARLRGPDAGPAADPAVPQAHNEADVRRPERLPTP